jgi:hypothetical protein
VSDFLSHLAARSAAPELALRPRPVSRFEPAPGRALEQRPAVFEQTDEEREPDAPQPGRSPRSRLLSPPVPSGRLRAEPDEVSPAAGPSGRAASARRSPAAVEARPSAPAPSEPRPARRLPSGEETESDLAPPKRRRHEPEPEPERRAEQAPAPEEAPRPRERVVVVERVRSVAASAAVESPVPPSAPPRIFPELLADRPPVHTEPEPEPDVHVTIGRIEVRAVPAAPSAPVVGERRPPVMTLEEYLRRRSEGTR